MDRPDTPFTTAAAEAAGWTRRGLAAAVKRGELRRVVRGVYAADDWPDTIESRAAAMSLVVSANQVVCDRTAAWLHGVDAFGLTDKRVAPPVEVCTLRGRSVTRLTGLDGRTRDLAAVDLMEMSGLRMTTPLRTAMDLGCSLPRHRALGVIDQFMRLHAITSEDLRRQLIRFRGRRGVVQLRSLIPLADPRAESMRESWLRLDIHDAGLPAPDLQVWVQDHGVDRYRLDHAYEAHRVAVEYDGEEFHLRTDAQREGDRIRREWLRQEGWTVIVVDKSGLHDPARRWLCELAEALAPRTRRLRWSRG